MAPDAAAAGQAHLVKLEQQLSLILDHAVRAREAGLHQPHTPGRCSKCGCAQVRCIAMPRMLTCTHAYADPGHF
jgi:hypothetical protein